MRRMGDAMRAMRRTKVKTPEVEMRVMEAMEMEVRMITMAHMMEVMMMVMVMGGPDYGRGRAVVLLTVIGFATSAALCGRIAVAV